MPYLNASHDALFKKLSKIGISGSFLKIIIDSFKNRKEFIIYNNRNSNPYCIKVDIPQGQISSAIYFNIYKSDLIECTGCLPSALLVLCLNIFL
jgi:Na+-transporting NADH:ubiquinone oxidoreductase subunit NqrF